MAQLRRDKSRFLNSLGERLDASLNGRPDRGYPRSVRHKAMTFFLLVKNSPRLAAGFTFRHAFNLAMNPLPN